MRNHQYKQALFLPSTNSNLLFINAFVYLVMNGSDEAGDKPDLESNEPNPKRARIDPEISNEKIHENTNDIGDTQEKDTSMKNTENDELG